jgi:hypothetical protein
MQDLIIHIFLIIGFWFFWVSVKLIAGSSRPTSLLLYVDCSSQLCKTWNKYTTCKLSLWVNSTSKLTSKTPNQYNPNPLKWTSHIPSKGSNILFCECWMAHERGIVCENPLSLSLLLSLGKKLGAKEWKWDVKKLRMGGKSGEGLHGGTHLNLQGLPARLPATAAAALINLWRWLWQCSSSRHGSHCNRQAYM